MSAAAAAIAALLSFAPPAGWTKVEYANAGGADPILRFEKGSDAIQVRLFGAPGSDYREPADFLAGPAGSDLGAEPARAGTAVVAGRKLELRRRRLPVRVSDPHGPASPALPDGSETFCVIPLREGRFAVLSYRRSIPIPDPGREGEKAWAAFLRGVKPR